MDIFAILGVVIGLGFILWAQALEGGNVTQLLQLTAGMIVLGGTTGALVGSFPVDDLKNAMAMLKDILMPPKVSLEALIVEIVGLARKEGVISLEKEAKNASDALLTMGLETVADGADPSLVQGMMENQVTQLEEKVTRASKVFEAAGAYSPTFGIIGAVLGLIQVMQNLSDPSKLGAGIAVAFVATVYGLFVANLIFIPVSTRLKANYQLILLSKEIMIEGILSIQAGESPALIERKLQSFILGGAKGAKE